MLFKLEEELSLYSVIVLKRNESILSNYRCLSCILDSAFTNTDRLNMCDNKIENQDTVSLIYCYNMVDTGRESNYCNINRTIFKKRLIKKG